MSDDLQIREVVNNPRKFQQATLYVLNCIGDSQNVSKRLLHMLLYLIDFDHYEKFEESLMGEEYKKDEWGPSSASLEGLMEEMLKQGSVEKVKILTHSQQVEKYVARLKPSTDIFSSQEIEHMDDVLERFSDMEETALSQYLKEDMPLKAGKMRESLSYEIVFYRGDEHSVREYDDEI